MQQKKQKKLSHCRDDSVSMPTCQVSSASGFAFVFLLVIVQDHPTLMPDKSDQTLVASTAKKNAK